MKKIGILALALVMALGALGIGYAAWTDTITIEGTVNTGDVDINVVEYSSTYVFKNTITDEIIIRSVPLRLGTHEILIASAVAEPGNEDDTVKITYTNLFPSIDFVADVLLRYDGSIPVKISVADFSVDGDAALIALWEAGETNGTGAWIEWWWSDENGTKLNEILGDPRGIQLHEGDYILVEGHIHLPQDDALMNQNGTFTATLTVIQWNEYNNEG